MITKSINIAIVFLALSTPVAADPWVNVADAATGERLFADVESITFEKYKNDAGKEGYLASCIMKYTSKDYIAPFLSAIDVEECMTKNSGSLIVALPDNTTKTYFWSNGKQMYDAQGQFLCGYTRAKLKRSTISM